MRAQEELIFVHVHCRYGSAWGDIARHLPQQSPEALRIRWGLICETGRGCEQLLSNYAYNVKQGMPPAVAFFECVKRLPPGAKSRLLDGACSEHEFDQVSAALATAADLAKCQAIAEAALAGRTIRVSQDAEERAAALAAAVVAAGGGTTTPTRRKKPAVRFGSGPDMHPAAARMPHAEEAALRRVSGPAGTNSTANAAPPQAGLAAAAALSAHARGPTPIGQQLQAAAAAAAAAARAGSLMQDAHGGSSGAAAWPRGAGPQGPPGQLPSRAGDSAGVGLYPGYGSQKIATAKMAAEAYHAQKRQRWDDAARMRELWRQQQQQQPQDSQRVTPQSQQSRQHPQQEHRAVGQVQQQLTGTKRPHADSQQEQVPQPGGARGGAQQVPSFDQLRSSLAALASQGMPQDAAADMLQQIQSYLMGMKSGSGSAAAPQGHSPQQAAAAAAAARAPEFGGASSTAAGTAQAAGATASGNGSGAAAAAAAVSNSTPFRNLPPQLVAELKAAWKREQQKLQQKVQQAQPTSTVSEPAATGRDSSLLQQTQDDSKPSPQQQSQKAAISLMEDIYRLEQAVRQQEENIRRHQQQQQQQRAEPQRPEPQLQRAEPQQQQHQQQRAEPQQQQPVEPQQQQLAAEKQEGASTQRSDGTVGGQSMLQEVNKEDTSDSIRAVQQTAPKPADGSRQGAFAAVKERLRQAPDRPEIINQVMAKLHVDLSDISQSTQAACSPHSRPPSAQPSLTTFRSQSPASTGFEAAVKRNRQALLWEATAAVMDKREPVVRLAKPVHRGGTRRVISLEALKATTLGKHTLTALQKLLLVPDELPAGARLVFEVAVPPAADAGEAAGGTHTSGQQVEGADAAGDGQHNGSTAAEGNTGEQAVLVEAPTGTNMTQTQSSEHGEQQEAEADAEQPPTATSAAAPSPFAAATAAAAAAAAAAEALEGTESVQQQTDKAGHSVGVVLVHAQAGLDSAMLSDDAVASTGSKRSRDCELQEPIQEEPLKSSTPPSAKRSPRAELFL